MTNLALAWLIVASAAPAQESAILRLTPSENLENKYSLKVNLNFEKSDYVFTADLSNRIVQVLEDGSFVMASSQKNAQLIVAGAPIKGDPNKAPTFTTLSKMGQTIAITGDDIKPDDYRFANLTAFICPEKEVPVDGTWTIEQKGDAQTGSIATKGQYRLLAQEEVSGRKCHKIGFEIAETEGSLPASAKGIFWIDRNTGFTVKMAAELKSAPLAGALVDAVVEMTLLPLT